MNVAIIIFVILINQYCYWSRIVL